VLRLLRAVWPALACFAGALAIGIGAIVDHSVKQRRIDRAQVSDYFCTHYGVRCGGPSWHRIERSWNRRQVVYEVAVGTFAALGLGLAGYRLTRLSTTSSWRSER
jgi:hypothetical protein